MRPSRLKPTAAPQRSNAAGVIGHRTLDQVATIMAQRGYPMTKTRVREIERNALAKMRRAFIDDSFSASPCHRR